MPPGSKVLSVSDNHCFLCNLSKSSRSSGANFLIGRMLNGGGEQKQQHDQLPNSAADVQDAVQFPLQQDTDPEESPSSAASTAFRQDLSDSQRNAFATNGGSNLAGECTCEDGEVRVVKILHGSDRIFLPELERAREI